ncbi:alcohol dehydrogenase catalytic domain-containing protein [Nocardioides houyundeii]|uniref:alcohol dehydrogenase catalytic domain-containing protein n=1 Tax=Nocardioides houyundeii TaxID=2045452 RepID=UPI000DF18871
MRAVVHDHYGDPSQVLRLAELPPVGAPGPGEVSIRVTVRPAHPGDLLGITGGDGPAGSEGKRRIPGFDGAGVVTAVGRDVADLQPGQRVAFFPVSGAWAEHVVAAASAVVAVPDEIDEPTAALMLVNPVTMRMLLRALDEAWAGTPRPFVQTAAGSSVGRLVAAAAERHDFPLVNLVRSTAGAAALTERFPSLTTISTSEPDWSARMRDALGGPASVVLDAVGGTLATDLLAGLADGGSLISYGGLSGSPVSLGATDVVGRELRIRGVSIGRWSRLDAEQRGEDVAFALATAQARPDLFEVAASYDLADFATAVGEVGRPGKVGAVLLTSPTEQSA